MTLYEKNLKTLAKYYPEMDERIREAKKEISEDLEIIEEVSDDGVPILKIIKDGRTCYLNGKRNALEPTKIWVKTLGELKKNAPVLMVGLGNPCYLKDLAEQTETPIVIIVYEPSLQIFLKFLELVDIKQWMQKHLIIFWVDGLKDMDEKHLREVMYQVLIYEMLDASRNLILPNYDILFPEASIRFMKMCRDIAIAEAMSYNTKNNFSNIMVRNLFSNARYLCKGYTVAQLPEVIPRDIPGILVAAGPSLNKNIHELKKAKGKAFIIAVDTALKPLIDAGIVPDMFAIIDAQKPLDLVKIEEARKIPLLTTLNAAPEVLDYHTGMKFFYNEGYQFAEEIFAKTGKRSVRVIGGGSVATHCFSFLFWIGIPTVILVGQDLAYTDNKSHADGTFHKEMEQVDTSAFMTVEGNYEDKVPTRLDFRQFLNWYNLFIADCKAYYKRYGQEFRVVNATEGGAKIGHTEIMSLKDVIEQECTKEVDIQECMNKLTPMLDEENKIWAVDYLKTIASTFQRLSAQTVKLRKLYQKLAKISSKMNIDITAYQNITKKIKRQKQILEKDNAYQLIAITLNKAQYILSNEQFLREDTMQAEGKEIARKGMLYMESVGKMAELFKELSEELFSEDELKRFI